MKIGYGRVSTIGQSLEIQEQRLTEAGCEKIFSEKFSGKQGLRRDQLEAAIDFAREGDIFICTKLDRLARSVSDLVNIAQRLDEKKVDLVILDQAIDTTTAAGKLMFHMLASIGEFERSLINERTAEGRAAAKANGVQFGRPAALKGWPEKKIRKLITDFDQGEIPKNDLAARHNMGRSTLYRVVTQARTQLAIGDPDQVTLDEMIDSAS